MGTNEVYRQTFDIKNWNKKPYHYVYETHLEMVCNTKWRIEISKSEIMVAFIGSDVERFRADFEFILNGKEWQSLVYYRSSENQSDWLKLQFPQLKDSPESQKVRVRITLIKNSLVFSQLTDIQNRYLLNGFVSDFKTQFESNSSTDFTICVKDREFSVHSQILSARSPVLRAMLTIDMKEKRERKATLHDIEPKTFETLLKFIYFCEISEIYSMTDEEKVDLFKAADFYDMKDLRQLIITKMFIPLTVENVKKALQTAYRYGIPCLENQCYEFIADNKTALISPL